MPSLHENSIKRPPSNLIYHFHGFDIFSDQFPAEHDSLDFSIHDAMNPFPEEHLNRYDVVHIRLLVLAIKEGGIPTFVRNTIQLFQ
jgi:hypothetical protein